LSLRIGVDGRYLRDDHPGIGRHLFGALRALAASAGDEELLVLHDPRAPRTRLDPAALVGRSLRLVPAPWRPRSPAEQFGLPRLLRRLGLDLFHAPYPFTALACPCPRVVTVYDLIALDPRHGLRAPLARALAGCVLRRVTRGAAAVLTLSHAVRAALVERLGLPAQRVAVIGAAADPAFQPAAPEAVAAARRALGLPARYVLHVGTPKPHKNRARLLRAWSALRPDGVALVLAGSPASPHARREELPEGVRDLGPVDERHLPALYSAAELCVLPSLDEGFGLPVLEAMGCGTPVACSARGALGEVAGDAAACFDPEDERALGATLARLLGDADARRALSQRGLARARLFTWEALAARTWALYRCAARGPAAALEGDVVGASPGAR
jgi:alpha-1,3-rhamnosyl/mannosyltransferase